MDGQQIQVENGNFARVHNAILTALSQANLNGSEFRCLMFLFRRTYGFSKKEEEISYEAWAKGTGLERRNTIRTLQALEKKRVLYSNENGNNRPKTWGFNKYTDEWEGCFPKTSGEFDTSGEVASGENDTSLGKTSGEIDTSTSGEFDTSLPQAGGQIDTKTSGQIDTPYKERKENSSSSSYTDQPAKATAAAAATTAPDPPIPKQPEPDAKLAGFVKEYERVWCLMLNGYHADKVKDWCQRVPVEAWSYALKECADTRNVGNWKYFEKILSRVEIEGLSPARQAQMPPPIQSGKTGLSLGKILSTAGAMT